MLAPFTDAMPLRAGLGSDGVGGSVSQGRGTRPGSIGFCGAGGAAGWPALGVHMADAPAATRILPICLRVGQSDCKVITYSVLGGRPSCLWVSREYYYYRWSLPIGKSIAVRMARLRCSRVSNRSSWSETRAPRF